MSQEILGRVRPVYQGEYDETKTYSYMDRVFYNSNVYEVLVEPPAGTLPTNSVYWCLLQENGLKGEKGETGPAGLDGSKGEQGNRGETGEIGDRPFHSWSGTTLYIQDVGGELDTGTNLKGPKGLQGVTGEEGNQIELSDAIDSTDKTKAASSYAVKLAYDYATNKETPISDVIDSDSSITAASSKAVKTAASESAAGQFFLVGSIMPFYGSFGGTNNRFPIPIGSTTPDTNWVICDGATTNGIAVPDLRARFIKGGTGSNQKTTGGSVNHSHKVYATGATTISVSQMPAHQHYYTEECAMIASVSYSEGTKVSSSHPTTTVTTGPGSYASGSHSHAASTSASSHNWPPCYTLSFIMKIA